MCPDYLFRSCPDRHLYVYVYTASMLNLSASVKVHVSAAKSVTLHTGHLIMLFLIPNSSFQ